MVKKNNSNVNKTPHDNIDQSNNSINYINNVDVHHGTYDWIFLLLWHTLAISKQPAATVRRDRMCYI